MPENMTQTTQPVPEPQESPHMSPMEQLFLITGVLFAASVMLGIIYAILYHTRISHNSRRKIMRRQTIGDVFGGRRPGGRSGGNSGGGPKRTKTSFGMMSHYNNKR